MYPVIPFPWSKLKDLRKATIEIGNSVLDGLTAAIGPPGHREFWWVLAAHGQRSVVRNNRQFWIALTANSVDVAVWSSNQGFAGSHDARADVPIVSIPGPLLLLPSYSLTFNMEGPLPADGSVLTIRALVVKLEWQDLGL